MRFAVDVIVIGAVEMVLVDVKELIVVKTVDSGPILVSTVLEL